MADEAQLRIEPAGRTARAGYDGRGTAPHAAQRTVRSRRCACAGTRGGSRRSPAVMRPSTAHLDAYDGATRLPDAVFDVLRSARGSARHGRMGTDPLKTGIDGLRRKPSTWTASSPIRQRAAGHSHGIEVRGTDSGYARSRRDRRGDQRSRNLAVLRTGTGRCGRGRSRQEQDRVRMTSIVSLWTRRRAAAMAAIAAPKGPIVVTTRAALDAAREQARAPAGSHRHRAGARAPRRDYSRRSLRDALAAALQQRLRAE